MATKNSYFDAPASVIEFLKWLIPFTILFVGWCIKIEITQAKYDYRITEITRAIDTQNQALREIQTTLKEQQVEKSIKAEKLSAIEAKVDLILARDSK